VTSLTFGGIGPYGLMLIAAAGLLVPVVLTVAVHRRERRAAAAEATQATAEHVHADDPIGKRGGFELVFKDRYLLLIALLVLVFNLVNTLGGFVLNTMIIQEAATRVAAGAAGGLDERAIIGTLAGTVQTWVNLLAVLLQAFLVSRIF
jgi:AAA family ATP:ADP antiporter